MNRPANQSVQNQNKQQGQKEPKLAYVNPDRMLRSDENPIPKYFINYIIGTVASLVTINPLFVLGLFGYFKFVFEAWQVAVFTGMNVNGIVCLILTYIFGRAELPKRR